MRNGPIPLSRGRGCRACHRDNRVTKRGLLCDGGETRAARSIWQAIAASTGAAVPGCRVDESVREIKRGPGDLPRPSCCRATTARLAHRFTTASATTYPRLVRVALTSANNANTSASLLRSSQGPKEAGSGRGGHDRAPAVRRHDLGCAALSGTQPLNSTVKTPVTVGASPLPPAPPTGHPRRPFPRGVARAKPALERAA